MITISNEKHFNSQLKRFKKKSVKDFDRVVADATNKMHSKAVNAAPTGRSGKLRQNVRIAGKGVVLSKMDYSAAVEEGTKPHWPNMGDLKMWTKKIVRPPAKRLDSVNYLIGRKISKEGTEEQPFMRPAWEHGRKVLYRGIKKVL